MKSFSTGPSAPTPSWASEAAMRLELNCSWWEMALKLTLRLYCSLAQLSLMAYKESQCCHLLDDCDTFGHNVLSPFCSTSVPLASSRSVWLTFLLWAESSINPSNSREKFSRMLVIKPRATGWEARMLPLCYAAPLIALVSCRWGCRARPVFQLHRRQEVLVASRRGHHQPHQPVSTSSPKRGCLQIGPCKLSAVDISLVG